MSSHDHRVLPLWCSQYDPDWDFELLSMNSGWKRGPVGAAIRDPASYGVPMRIWEPRRAPSGLYNA